MVPNSFDSSVDQLAVFEQWSLIAVNLRRVSIVFVCQWASLPMFDFRCTPTSSAIRANDLIDCMLNRCLAILRYVQILKAVELNVLALVEHTENC